MLSQYQSASDSKALSRYHRHNEQARGMSENVREARWYQCFRQLEGQWEEKEDAQTRVTGTDFSVLPAGYAPKRGRLPQWRKPGDQAHNKYGSADESLGAKSSPMKAASKAVGCGPRRSSAAMAWTPAEPNQQVARQGGLLSTVKRKLKGAEYVKADMVPLWLKKCPTKLKQADLVAALKPSAVQAPHRRPTSCQ